MYSTGGKRSKGSSLVRAVKAFLPEDFDFCSDRLDHTLDVLHLQLLQALHLSVQLGEEKDTDKTEIMCFL